jgi:hypothetical protein
MRAASRDAWSAVVSETRVALETAIDAGLVHTGAALDHLHTLATDARISASDAIGVLEHPDDLGPLTLPLPQAPSRTLVGEALGGWGGREGARRVVRAHIARWLADGQLVLEEWLEGSAVFADEVARRARAQAAVAEARAALAGGRT